MNEERLRQLKAGLKFKSVGPNLFFYRHEKWDYCERHGSMGDDYMTRYVEEDLENIISMSVRDIRFWTLLVFNIEDESKERAS